MGQSEPSKHVVAAAETIQIQEAKYVTNNPQLLFDMEPKKFFKKKGKKGWKKTRFREVGLLCWLSWSIIHSTCIHIIITVIS